MNLSILETPVFDVGFSNESSTESLKPSSSRYTSHLILPSPAMVNAATYNQPTSVQPTLKSPYDMNLMDLYHVTIEDSDVKTLQQQTDLRARQAHMAMVDNLLKHEGLTDGSGVTNMQAQQLLARYQQQMNYMLQHQNPELRQMKPMPAGAQGVSGVMQFDPATFFSEGMRKARMADINQPPKPRVQNINISRQPSAIAPPGVPIYEATYSSSEVFELVVGEVGVMRRKTDGWVNGTHILKVAGVDKGRRTKLLDKEVAGEPHERVQGGYGRFQGTWMPVERARKLALDYGVPDQIAPLLDIKI